MTNAISTYLEFFHSSLERDAMNAGDETSNKFARMIRPPKAKVLALTPPTLQF